MKRKLLACLLCSLSILIFGCASQSENEINLDNMNASEILDVLVDAGFPITEPVVEDPDSVVGTLYTSKVSWFDSRGTNPSDIVVTLEVFENDTDAIAAKDAISLDDCIASGKDCSISVYNNVLIYVSAVGLMLTTDQMTIYDTALDAMANGQAPEYVTE